MQKKLIASASVVALAAGGTAAAVANAQSPYNPYQPGGPTTTTPTTTAPTTTTTPTTPTQPSQPSQPNVPVVQPDGTQKYAPGTTVVNIPAPNGGQQVKVEVPAPAAGQTVTIAATTPGNYKVTVPSGAGNVNLLLPLGKQDVTIGSTGTTDAIIQDAGGSTIKGAEGNERIRFSGSGQGTGTTVANLGGGNNTVRTPGSNRRATSRAAASYISYVVKTLGGRDVVAGGFGKLSAYTGGGNDQISAGSGGGRLSGQDGNDTIRGGTGATQIFGGNGNDKMYAGKAVTRVSGGNGNDYISSVNGKVDRIGGGKGRDRARVGKKDKVSSVESVRRSSKN